MRLSHIVRGVLCDRPCHDIVGWIVGTVRELWINGSSFAVVTIKD